MRYIGVDSETVPFSPGDMAPALVCVQWRESRLQPPELATVRGGAVARVRAWLLDPNVTLVGHNIAYDAAVWCAAGLTDEVFAAYRAGRLVCTWVFERLGEIAGFSTRKKLSLAVTCKAHGLRVDGLKGGDGDDDPEAAKALARDFARFLEADDIPEPHRSYALGDCIVLELFERQRRRFGAAVPDAALQSFSRTMFWLQLMSVWGVTTHGDLVAAFAADTAEQLAYLRPLAQTSWGAVLPVERSDGRGKPRVTEDVFCPFLRPNGTRNMAAIKRRVEEAYGAACPRTPTGQASTAQLVLEESGDPMLEGFAHYAELIKAESTDIPMLSAGILHPRYGLADTGRTTCSKPNLQNLPGGGQVRGCITAPEGYALLERDYAGVELCALAQVGVFVLGDYEMAEAINAAGDPGFLHALVGGQLLGCSPEELLARRAAGDDVAENARTRAKNGVFGFMGGLGDKSYPEYVRKLSKGKVNITLAQSKAIKAAVFQAVPTMQRYLKYVASTERPDQTFEAVIPGSGILRRGMWYCASANCRFQGLAAAVMHEAGWRLAQACYCARPGDVWYGVRPVAFIHDAFVLQVPLGTLHEVDVAFEQLLADAAASVMPDVVTKTEGHAALSLAKKVRGQKAKRAVDKNGRLVPWTPLAA